MRLAGPSRLRPTLCADEGVTRAHEKFSPDQRGEHFAAEHRIESPQAGGLGQGQPQTRHLPEIRLRSTNRFVEYRVDINGADSRFRHRNTLRPPTLASARQGAVTGTSRSRD